jgi:RloB-like protein
MGRDYSASERQRVQLERKNARRATYDRILIISEGSKTEPNYFREIRALHRLHTANVEILPSALGTNPLQIVEYAKSVFEFGDRHKNIQPKAFEQVFVVFDRDEHDGYHDALRVAESLNRKLRNDARQPVIFKAIASVPNFELWLLLHFEDVHAPAHRTQVLSSLKKYLPEYEKGAENVFALTSKHLEVAIERAERLQGKYDAYSDPEPFTAVFELVRLLVSLRL